MIVVTYDLNMKN